MSNKIRLIKHEQQLATGLDPDRYEFNPRGRLPWLQRLLFKGTCETPSQRAQYNHQLRNRRDRHLANPQRPDGNQRDVANLYNKRARYVVMGTRDLARLMETPEIREALYFTFSSPIGINGKRTILGLEVVALPWIEGFFVLPDLQDEKWIRAAS